MSTLKKLGTKDKSVFKGKLCYHPMKGRAVMLNLESDNQYVTSPIVRILQTVDNNTTIYMQTMNTKYKLTIE